MGAPTRLSMISATSRIRSRPSNRMVTVSPTRTGVEGLVTDRFTDTCPDRQASVAKERVLNTRTDHNQRSIRVLSIGQLFQS